jgi:hypothetical protein
MCCSHRDTLLVPCELIKTFFLRTVTLPSGRSKKCGHAITLHEHVHNSTGTCCSESVLRTYYVDCLSIIGFFAHGTRQAGLVYTTTVPGTLSLFCEKMAERWVSLALLALCYEQNRRITATLSLL